MLKYYNIKIPNILLVNQYKEAHERDADAMRIAKV